MLFIESMQLSSCVHELTSDTPPEISYEENNRLIDESKQQMGAEFICK
jgi:hypothetical protein